MNSERNRARELHVDNMQKLSFSVWGLLKCNTNLNYNIIRAQYKYTHTRNTVSCFVMYVEQGPILELLEMRFTCLPGEKLQGNRNEKALKQS
mmetsp:Transcript_9434/g.11852  ORF Transcript_9434/g.11852 Transcript_9434/m.11852 type:complete len:92 (-) Transcript_9434:2229-2504(-)